MFWIGIIFILSVHTPVLQTAIKKAPTNVQTTETLALPAATTQAATNVQTTKTSALQAATTQPPTNVQTTKTSAFPAATTQAATNVQTTKTSALPAATTQPPTNVQTTKTSALQAATTQAATNVQTTKTSALPAATTQAATNVQTTKTSALQAATTKPPTNVQTTKTSSLQAATIQPPTNVQTPSTIVLFSKNQNPNYTAFVQKKGRIIYLISTFGTKWRNAVKECKQMGGKILEIADKQTKKYLDGVPGDRNTQKGSYYVDGIQVKGKSWTFENGTKMTIIPALWKQGEPNGGNKNSYCAFLEEGKLYDARCTNEKRFLCQRKILPFLRLPASNGHIELQYNDTWGPLCFDLELTDVEARKICQDQYDSLYETFSNVYTYPVSNYSQADYNHWYDNPDYSCTFNKLHCEGDSPGEPIINFKENEAYMGNSLNLSCTVVGGIPKPIIEWNREGNALSTRESWTRPQDKVVFSGTTSLTLSADDHNSSFSCIVNYKGNDSYIIDVNLNVSYAPIITLPNYVQVNETDDVIIECHVSSNPLSIVTWTPPGKTDQINGTNLNLTNIYRAATGNYTCRAENVYRNQPHIEQNTTMVYINAPPKMCLYQHEFTENNGTVRIRCSATGIPTPNLTWYRLSHLITNTHSTNHIIEPGITPDNKYLVHSMLTVSGVGDGDLLGYRCVVTNGNGVAQKTFRIHRKLKCRCLSRLLKNCAPLKIEPKHLAGDMIKTKTKLAVNKHELTSNKIKLTSVNDNRPSSSAIGLLGVGILCMMGVVLVCFDLFGYFVINPSLKNSSKTRKRARTKSRSRIETPLPSRRNRCQSSGDILLSDIDERISNSDQHLSKFDPEEQISQVYRHRTATTAVVHANPQMCDG